MVVLPRSVVVPPQPRNPSSRRRLDHPGLRLYRSYLVFWLSGFDLHPKKVDNGHRWASGKRTREWTWARLRPNHYNWSLMRLGPLAAWGCYCHGEELAVLSNATLSQAERKATWGCYSHGEELAILSHATLG
ncbi:hypothetical protein BHM03_00029127 [Ensete ventricosum]|nr:hypothetical protein BHM03_00029127 [Ensete ventricosum]